MSISDFYKAKIAHAKEGNPEAMDYIYNHFRCFRPFKIYITRLAEYFNDKRAIEFILSHFDKYQIDPPQQKETQRNTIFNDCIVWLAKERNNRDALETILKNPDDLSFSEYIKELGYSGNETARKIIVNECKAILGERHCYGFSILQENYIEPTIQFAIEGDKDACETILDIENHKRSNFIVISKYRDASKFILDMAREKCAEAKDIIYNCVQNFYNLQKDNVHGCHNTEIENYLRNTKDGFETFVIKAAIENDDNAKIIVYKYYNEMLIKTINLINSIKSNEDRSLPMKNLDAILNEKMDLAQKLGIL